MYKICNFVWEKSRRIARHAQPCEANAMGETFWNAVHHNVWKFCTVGKKMYYFLVMHLWIQCYTLFDYIQNYGFLLVTCSYNCFKCFSILIEMLGMNIHPNSLHSLLREVCSRRGMTRTSRASAKSKSYSRKSARSSEEHTDVKRKTWCVIFYWKDYRFNSKAQICTDVLDLFL